MEMGKNVRMSVLLMAAFVMVATVAPAAMAIRENIPLALALRQRGIPVIQPEEGRFQQQLAEMMLEAVAAAKNNEGVLRCIPKANRCGPKTNGVYCCAPYTCTSDYYGICV